jgi:hypothetical protein
VKIRFPVASGGGLFAPSFRMKLFINAQAPISVPTTEK